jgi:hypothetical protein
MVDSWPKNATFIGTFELPSAQLIQDKTSHSLVLRNAEGHMLRLSDGQWRDLLMQSETCGCGACLPCVVYNMTLDIIEEDEKTVEFLNNDEVDLLIDTIEERDRYNR